MDDVTTTYYRYQDDAETVGAILRASRVWIEDEPINEEILDGTCCFETLDMVLDYAGQGSGGYILTVEGVEGDCGELDGEILVRNATVINCDLNC